VNVKLIAWSNARVSDPRKLVILAVKVSCGKIREKGLNYYLDRDYSDEDYRRWLIDSLKYPSVLEHIVFTFYIEGISRICSHQLVRHRIASYTQESQRYSESYMRKAVEKIASVLEENFKSGCFEEYVSLIEKFLKRAEGCSSRYAETVVEVAQQAFVIPPHLPLEEKHRLAKFYLKALAEYYKLLAEGIKKEDARFIVPQAVKTALLMTVNMRELLHIAKLRLSSKAQWEIRELVRRIVEEVSKIIPELPSLIEDYEK